MLKYIFTLLLISGAILAPGTPKVIAQAIPTTLPSTVPTIYPTVAPTTYPTTVATTYPTTIPAYATSMPTTAPTTYPTVLPGTPPPSAPMLAGCQVFPKGDIVYNKEIYDQPVDTNSDAYMASFLAGVPIANKNIVVSGKLAYWQINLADSSTPSYSLVTNTGTVINNITTFPFDPSFEWEYKDIVISGSDDHHLMVLNISTCHEYEAYNYSTEPPVSFSVVNGEFQTNTSAKYGHEWDLTQPYPNPPTAGAVNAASVPHFAGMVRWDDYLQGCVCHALNMDVYMHSLRGGAYVYPANGPEAVGYYTGPSQYSALALPLGSHLRLKRSYTLTCSVACPVAQMVVLAWKVYGAYVMDTGGYAGVAYFSDAYLNGKWTFPWNTTDIQNLSTVPMSAFEVVAPPNCSSVEACIK